MCCDHWTGPREKLAQVAARTRLLATTESLHRLDIELLVRRKEAGIFLFVFFLWFVFSSCSSWRNTCGDTKKEEKREGALTQPTASGRLCAYQSVSSSSSSFSFFFSPDFPADTNLRTGGDVCSSRGKRATPKANIYLYFLNNSNRPRSPHCVNPGASET